MRIGIDVESGERPFEEYVKGAITVSKTFPNLQVYIIGDTKKLLKYFPNLENNNRVHFVDAREVIEMDELPIKAVQKKKKSSIVIGINLLKEKIIDAFFSPGNTGAIVAASILNLGMIDDIKRPAMATFFPRNDGEETLLLDIGANPDANEINLYQNAILGEAYYRVIYNKKNPSIGLLNMGGESIKGTNIHKKTYELMKKMPNFKGNVEGYNVFDGTADVIVCSGFVGNSILKIAEAIKKFILSALRDSFKSSSDSLMNRMISYVSRIFGVFSEKKRKLVKRIIPKYFGAAPLLGVRGIVLIGHGAGTTDDLINAVELAYKLYEIKYLEKLSLLIKNN